MQKHSARLALPGTELEFAGHPRHALRASDECVPPGHTAHAALPLSDDVPAPQSWHVLPESAPVAVECLPAPQSEHAAEPRAALWDT